MKFCEACNKEVKTNIVKRKETYTVHGEPIEVIANVMTCAECGEEIFNEALDQATLLSVFDKYNELHRNERENRRECQYVLI